MIQWKKSEIRTFMFLCFLELAVPVCKSPLCWNLHVVVQLPSCVLLFATPWTVAHQASPSLTISRSLPKFMSIALVSIAQVYVYCIHCTHESCCVRPPKMDRVIVESSDKMWSTGGGNGKPPQYTCHENLTNCITGQKPLRATDTCTRGLPLLTWISSAWHPDHPSITVITGEWKTLRWSPSPAVWNWHGSMGLSFLSP